MTHKKSLVNLLYWKAEVEERVGSKPCILIGNKLDLINYENNKVEKEEVDLIKSALSANCYFETSAKAGFNIEKAFKESAKCILKDLNKSEHFIKH